MFARSRTLLGTLAGRKLHAVCCRHVQPARVYRHIRKKSTGQLQKQWQGKIFQRFSVDVADKNEFGKEPLNKS